MQILIVYATYSGGTMTAAQHLQQSLAEKANDVTMLTADAFTPESISGHDLVILCSPSWDYHGEEGMPHEDYQEVFQRFKDQDAKGQQFAVMGLGDSHYTKFCGSADHLADFVKGLGGTLVEEPLKIDQYFFNEEGNNQDIAVWAEKVHTAAKAD